MFPGIDSKCEIEMYLELASFSVPGNEAKLELHHKLINTDTIRREENQDGIYSPYAIYYWCGGMGCEATTFYKHLTQGIHHVQSEQQIFCPPSHRPWQILLEVS